MSSIIFSDFNFRKVFENSELAMQMLVGEKLRKVTDIYSADLDSCQTEIFIYFYLFLLLLNTKWKWSQQAS